MKISEIAEQTDASMQPLSADQDIEISSIAALDKAAADDVSFLTNSRYADLLVDTKAAAVLVPSDFEHEHSQDVSAILLRVDDVNVALEKLLEMFAFEPDFPAVGVHSSANIDDTAKLGNDVAIGANVVIGAGVRIGDGTVISPGCVIGRDVQVGRDCVLWANVVVNCGCILGDSVVIHPNSTIGADGFGYRMVGGVHRKIPHIGRVVIEDNVEIGANSCIDRAKFGITRVGSGSKIDNLVQIAHNVQIGNNCIIVAQAGIAGSCELGNYVVLAGQCGLRDHLKLGDGAMVGPLSGLDRDAPPGAKMLGTPAREYGTFFRQLSFIQKLPDMARELKKLRKLVEKLEQEKKTE